MCMLIGNASRPAFLKTSDFGTYKPPEFAFLNQHVAAGTVLGFFGTHSITPLAEIRTKVRAPSLPSITDDLIGLICQRHSSSSDSTLETSVNFQWRALGGPCAYRFHPGCHRHTRIVGRLLHLVPRCESLHLASSLPASGSPSRPIPPLQNRSRPTSPFLIRDTAR